MDPCGLTVPTVSLVSVTGSKVDFHFHGRKVRVFVSGKEVKDLPKNLQKIQNATQARLFLKNAYILTQETADGPFLHVHQRGGGGATYSVTINGQVVTAGDREAFLELLIPQLELLGVHQVAIQNLRERANHQELTAQQFISETQLLITHLENSVEGLTVANFQQHLENSDFRNCARYFALIQAPNNRKIVLESLINTNSSRIFQLGFHLVDSLGERGRNLVDLEFPRPVADIILNHNTRQFYFSLPSTDLSQAGWEMAVGNYSQDKRNNDAHWVMAIDPKGVKGQGSWKLVPQDKGRFFHIRCPNSNAREEEWYYLSSHRNKHIKDIRDHHSSWLYSHKPGWQGKNWEFRYLPNGTFHIAMEEDYEGQKGWLVSSHRYYDKDKRHELSTWMMIVDPQYGNALNIQMRD